MLPQLGQYCEAHADFASDNGASERTARLNRGVLVSLEPPMIF